MARDAQDSGTETAPQLFGAFARRDPPPLAAAGALLVGP